MPVGHVQQWGGFNSANVFSANSSTVTVTAGNYIFVACSITIGSSGDSVSLSVTDNLGNSYIQSGSDIRTDVSTSHVVMALFRAKIVTGGSCTITLSVGAYGNATFFRIMAHEVSSVDPTSPLDQTNSGTGSGSTISSGNVTTTFSDEFLHGYGIDNTGNPTPGSGWNSGVTEGSELDVWQIASAIGTYAATYTGDSNTWGCLIATYKGISGSTPALVLGRVSYGSEGNTIFSHSR